VGQALTDLHGDVDPGFGCRGGQAFGIAEQQVGRAGLDKQRRKPGQRREQRRGQGRLRVSAGQVVGSELTEHGGGGKRILIDALGHRGPRAGQIHRRGHQHGGRGQRLPGIARGHQQGNGQPSAGRVAGHRHRVRVQVRVGAQPAEYGQDVVDGGGERMLGGQAVFGEQHPHPAGPSQPGGQLAVAAQRPELETTAVQEQEHPVGVRSRGGQPVGRYSARGHLAHLHVVRHRIDAARGGEGGAALWQRRRGLAGAGLLPRPEGVDHVLHGLARHVGLSFSAGLQAGGELGHDVRRRL
jgi:hypothetical protein